MKNMDTLYRNVKNNMTLYNHWGGPLLGLLTAHHWFAGDIQSNWWWLLIVITVSSGVWKK